MIIQQRIFKFVARANWVLLLMAGAVAGALLPQDFTLGIIAGGLIVTLNFHLLYRSLKKFLSPPYLFSTRKVLVKYHLRFVSSILLIFILISREYVHPGGLLMGLSVVVASITLAGLVEARKIIFKEAL
ncbi:MAG: ATP synthase subunit I [Desulfobacterales bacterium]|nr:ATP synthase subunit I [Desulfobacterales bacterium]